MWGLRCPTPCGRTESCTLHILADVLLLVLTEKDCMQGGCATVLGSGV